MEHVEVLRDLSEVCRAAIKAGDWRVDGACDPDSLLRHADAALASLSAPQPPAEAQPVAVFNCPNCPVAVRSQWREPDCPECGERCFLDQTAKPAAPPSAPVGVEAAEHANVLRDLLADEYSEREDDGPPSFTLERAALQAAIDALAQQPAAVDGWRLVVHQSERDTKPAVWATNGDSFVWVADLAAQQGDSHD